MRWPFRTKNPPPEQALAHVLGNAELPSFPSIVLELMADLRDPELPVRNIAEKMRLDPLLSIRVLKMANAGAYGAKRAIDDVHHAAVFLGRRSLESLVLTVAVRQALPAPRSPVFNNRRFWRAAARRAATAQGLAGVLHPRTRGLSFTAALLQDMAIPMLVKRVGADYEPILREWHGDNTPLPELETARFGWTHATVAKWLCNRWEIPHTLSTAIAGHHQPINSDSEVPPAVSLVGQLNEHVDMHQIDKLIESARQRYNLAPDTAREVIQTAFERADDLAVILTE